MKGILSIGLLLVASGPALAQEPLDNRMKYMAPGQCTTDDVQRIPVPCGTNEVTGSFVLVGGRLFDGTGRAPFPATIVVTGKSIVAILKPDETNWPADAKVYRIDGKTVMPGLIDLHVHLSYVERGGLSLALSELNLAEATLRGTNRMKIFVQSGITSVRDMASHGPVPFALKRWQVAGRLTGPRIFPAGQLITAIGGHGPSGLAPTAPTVPAARHRVATGPDEFRAAVRSQFEQGADVIKIASHFTREEIKAAVDEAHSLGLPVAVDAETHFNDWAIEAGADTIEHPLPRSDAAIKMMADKNIASVLTLVPYRYISRESGGYFGSLSRRFALNETTIMAMARKLKAAGVKLGIGTDMVVDRNKWMPWAYIDELKSFALLGYTNLQVLQHATQGNAQILRMDDRLGTVSPGKLADLLVVAGSPDVSLDDIAKVDLVFVAGRLQVEAGKPLLAPHVPVAPPKPKEGS